MNAIEIDVETCGLCRSMLESGMSESRSKSVEVAEGTDWTLFLAVVEYWYSDSIDAVTPDNALALYFFLLLA